ncbi:MAG TPA: Ig-like domain-containing protein [Candidatus Bathyarchaeia archaeon]|nr:Ig-like domain-containing protein [Candidatus Bathyarchaeia archaeon]
MTFLKKIFLNYLFAFLLITLSVTGFVNAFDLDPGDPSNGGGDDDTIAPYIVLTPSEDIVSHKVAVEVVAIDFDSGVSSIKLYIDNVWKKTVNSNYCDYSWDTSIYDDKSIHTVKVIAKDNAGNERTRIQSYTIGYKVETQNYLHPSAYMDDGYEHDFAAPLAYTIIETDRFVIVMQITADSILFDYIGDTLGCSLDVVTMYYCKDNYRLDYDLVERPFYAPKGTLIELNFEMDESNTGLADNSIGIIVDDHPDDRSFWPNFQTPDKVAATDLGIDLLSGAISTLTGFLGLGTIGGFVVSKIQNHVIGELREGNTNPFDTGYVGATSVDINYRSLEPNGQNTLYPDGKLNYAYDAISRHSVFYRFDNDINLIGQTIGIKFRCNIEYVDDRTTTVDTFFSEWVKVEFKLVS